MTTSSGLVEVLGKVFLFSEFLNFFEYINHFMFSGFSSVFNSCIEGELYCGLGANMIY